MIKPEPNKMFAHALNAYSKWHNSKYSRTGRLFEARFERKKMDSDDQLRQLILYINGNPIHHKVVTDITKYPWVSLHSLLDGTDDWIMRDQVFSLFGDLQTFRYAVDKVDIDSIIREQWE